MHIFRQRIDMTDIYADILGHDEIKRGLLHAAALGRLHHAILMTGIAGVGKSLMARAFAQSIFCEQSTKNELKRCLKCANCMRIAQKTHPDVIEIEPEGAALKIDCIRELQKRLGLMPFETDKRFVIIKDVHKMQDAAANCLLKTLEEPDPYTSFILLTSQPQRLLPTIASRCQIVRFAPFDREIIAHYLVQNENIPEDAALQSAILANGSLGQAIDLAQGDYQTELIGLLDDILSMKSSDDALSAAASLKGKKDKADHLLLLLLTYMRDLALLKTSPGTPVVMTRYREAMMRRIDGISFKSIERVINNIMNVQAAFLGNVNETLAWERLTMGLHGIVFND